MKKLITSILLSLLAMISVLCFAPKVSAKYVQYVFDLYDKASIGSNSITDPTDNTAKAHTVEKTVFDERTVWKITNGNVGKGQDRMSLLRNGNYLTPEGNKIPFDDVKYALIDYYYYSPDASPSMNNKNAWFQVYNYLDSSGKVISKFSDGATTASGYFNSSTKYKANEWATLKLDFSGQNFSKVKSEYPGAYINYTLFYPFAAISRDSKTGPALGPNDVLYVEKITYYGYDPTGAASGENNITIYNFPEDVSDESAIPVLSGTYTSGLEGDSATSVITLPSPSAEKQDFTFIGWKNNNDGKLYPAGASYTFIDGVDTVFTGEWNSNLIYISQTGDDTSGTGTPDAPFASIAAAFGEIETDIGGTFCIVGNVPYADVPEHIGTMRYTSALDPTTNLPTGTLTYNGVSPSLAGPTVFKDINLLEDGGGSCGIFTYGNLLTLDNTAYSSTTVGSESAFTVSLGGTHINLGDEKVILKQTITPIQKVYIGGLENGVKYGTLTETNEVVIDGATIGTLYLGHSETYDHVIDGDVNIVFNSGTVQTFTKSGRKVGCVVGGVQIIFNNGTSFGSDSFATSGFKGTRGNWYIYSAATDGSAINPTDVTGTFEVLGDKSAIATERTTGKVYYSQSGMLTIPAGNYDITYESGGDTLVSNGTTITALKDFTIDFETFKADEIDGKLFLGWVDSLGNGVANNSLLTAGTTLTASYLDFDASYGGDFFVVGAQIRLSGVQGLRFIIQKNDSLNVLNSMNGEYGALVLPSHLLGANDLEINTTYKTYKSGEYTPAEVVGKNTFKTLSDGIQYTVCITNTPEKNYVRGYTVRGYIKFTDFNGFTRAAYSTQDETSIYEIAKYASENPTPSDIEHTDTLKQLINDAKTGYYEDGTTEILARGDNEYWAYKVNSSGLVVEEVEIDIDEELADPIEIAVIGDTHFNYLNEKDLENNEVVYTRVKRPVNPIGRGAPSVIRCLEYASMYDQTVIVGDVMDYLTLGNMELCKRFIFEKDKGILAAIGQHDIRAQMNTGRPEQVGINDRYNIVQQNWPHDVFYTKKLVNNKVMAIVLDNCNSGNYMRDYIAKRFAEDVKEARENGYVILIFQHNPTWTNNENEKSAKSIFWVDGVSVEREASFYTTDNTGYGPFLSENTERFTTEMYDLITSSADVVKGIFYGHVHSNYVSHITATYPDENGNPVSTFIPQYCTNGSVFFDDGTLIKITVK